MSERNFPRIVRPTEFDACKTCPLAGAAIYSYLSDRKDTRLIEVECVRGKILRFIGKERVVMQVRRTYVVEGVLPLEDKRTRQVTNECPGLKKERSS